MHAIATTLIQMPSLDVPVLIGFIAAGAWLVCWKEQHGSRVFTAGLITSSIVLAGVCFARPGVWPAGIVLAAWAGLVARRTFGRAIFARYRSSVSARRHPKQFAEQAISRDRIHRLFGSVESEN